MACAAVKCPKFLPRHISRCAGVSSEAMANSSRDRFELNLTAGDDSEPAVRREEGDAFRIAFIGDFSGRAERDPIAKRRPLIVDPDNFASVLRKLNVEIEFQGSRIPLTDLDDFHPDRLWANLPVFDSFRDLRRRLADPESFPSAAKELMGELPPPPPKSLSGAGLLDQMLGGTGAVPQRERPVDDLQAFIQKAVQPYLVASADPRAPELIARVDAAAAALMRSILHDPEVPRSRSGLAKPLAAPPAPGNRAGTEDLPVRPHKGRTCARNKRRLRPAGAPLRSVRAAAR